MQVFGEAVLLLLASAICLSGSQNFQTCSYFSSPLLLEADTTEKKIRIPDATGDSYRPNQNCKWEISTRNENHVIRLSVAFHYLEGRDIHGSCVADYVDLFDVKDGDKIFKQRLCGRSQGEEYFLSSETSMTVQFISNHRYQFRGFQAFYESYKKESQETKPSFGVVLGVVNATVVLIVILCVVLAVYRIRKRKESERNRAGIRLQAETHAGRSLSPHTASPSTYSTDLSPFVAMERSPAVDSQQHIASHLANDIRPPTPPPTYDEVSQATPVESNDVPPPSYDVAVRGSSHIESPTVDNTFI